MQVVLAAMSLFIISTCVGVACYIPGRARGLLEGYYEGAKEATEHYAKLFSQVIRTWLWEDFLGREEDDNA